MGKEGYFRDRRIGTFNVPEMKSTDFSYSTDSHIALHVLTL